MKRLLVAILLCLAMIGSLEPDGPARFEASLFPNPAATLSGNLSLAPSFLLQMTPEPGLTDATIFQATSTRVTILEHRFVHHLPSIGTTESGLPLQEKKESFPSNATRLQVAAWARESAWNLSNSAPGTATVAAHAECRLASAGPLLNVSCAAMHVAGGGRLGVRFFGSTIRLVDADGRNRTIVTGVTSEPVGPTGLRTWIHRTLLVDATSDDARWDLASPSRIAFASPSFGFAGDLLIPAESRGRVVWGPWQAAGTLPRIETSGVFAAAASPTNGVVMEGFAMRAPDPTGPNVASPFIPPAALFIAAAAAGLGILWLLRRALLAALGFSRTGREDALAHPRRRAILEAAVRRPGLGPAGLAAETGIPIGSLRHHLRIMLRHGHLKTQTILGRTLYFPPTPPCDRPEVLPHAVLGPRIRSLLSLLDTRPHMTQAQLAAELGVTQQAVSKMIRRLVRLGLFESPRRIAEHPRLG